MKKRHPIKLERTLLLLIKTKRIIITPTYCHNDIIMIKINRSISEICFEIVIGVSTSKIANLQKNTCTYLFLSKF